jgi:hypothetical protein
MLRTEGLPPQTAALKFQNQPLGLKMAPATTHCNPNCFTHATSPSQQHSLKKSVVALTDAVEQSSSQSP